MASKNEKKLKIEQLDEHMRRSFEKHEEYHTCYTEICEDFGIEPQPPVRIAGKLKLESLI